MAPTNISTNENMNGFKLIHALTANDTLPVHVYKSINTGITVCIATVEGPVVSGYFCLATEAHDDDGLPHTLEHLIFLGSEDHPYKGVLDLWANRCLASGTNAWTQTDHTAYTMTTAGSDGFLSLMPVYVEHILYPTLKDSAFLTEVHHINGKGEDAGVVYCEMQGKENTGECLVDTELSRALYPGHCGFKSNTGGALKNLRESTTNKKVRDYHKEFYRPENLTLVLAGDLNHANVFKALQSTEQKIMRKGSRPPFTKPWQSPVPPFKESVDLDVFYPCDDEDNGIVDIGWRGPQGSNKIYESHACDLLLKYLTDTSVSPLQKEFVEISDPFASHISYYTAEYTVSMLVLRFKGVPKTKLQEIKSHFINILGRTYKSGIDIRRMRTVVHKQILEILTALETNPHDLTVDMYCGYMLYGTDEKDLNRRLNQISELKKLEQEDEAYWLNLLKTYFIEAPSAVIKGIPSQQKRQEVTESEKKRIAQQVEDLGPDGLKKKEIELQAAIAENEVSVPDGLLDIVPIPSTDGISYHSIQTYTSTTVEQHPKFDVRKLPVYTYIDHIKTNFIYVNMVMNTSSIDVERRAYIPLLLEVILECPVKRNDRIVPYEEIVAELEADTVTSSAHIGFVNPSQFSCGIYSNAANLKLQLEMQKYEKGICWLKELLYHTVLTTDRLKIVATKMMNDVAQAKRQGNRIAKALMTGLIYKKDSNHYVTSILRLQKFLANVLERLNNEKEVQNVLSEIEAVRKILCASQNLTLHVSTNIDKLAAHVPDLYKAWDTFLPDEKNTVDVTQPVICPDAMLIKTPEEISIKGCVTGLGCIESAFLFQSCPCITDFNEPELPALLVCLQYLTQLEGPMWRLIRGQGLSYSYSIYPNASEGLLYLNFYRATNVIGAYKEAKSIAETHISENKWEKLLFESARSSLVFQFIDKEKTIGDLELHSLLCYLKKIPDNYNQEMVRRISSVTIDQMNHVATRYLKPLFEATTCRTTIVCHPMKAQEIVEEFKSLGQDLRLYNSLEESYLNDQS